jgi:hypothetical protein
MTDIFDDYDRWRYDAVRALSQKEMRLREVEQSQMIANAYPFYYPASGLQNYRPPFEPAPPGWREWFRVGDELR